MPRIPNSLLRKAHALDPFLPALLSPCRDLRAAQNELRWLREHVEGITKARRAQGVTLAKGTLLRDLVKQRVSGKPLQYILGTEYFGDLEITCRPGVLIPRQDTAASISHLARLIRDAQDLPKELRMLDLCTGTGCIPLLFHHEISTREDLAPRILGVDVSMNALYLARYNCERMLKGRSQAIKGSINFFQADVLINPFTDQGQSYLFSLPAALSLLKQPQFWDILISNPPYISPSAFWKTTRSVRNYEPHLALVPPPGAGKTHVEQGDAFYQPLLTTARHVEAKIVLLEIADMDQALRVARLARKMNIFDGIEIWRDEPDGNSKDAPIPDPAGEFPTVGQGNARSVLCWRGAGTKWLGKPPMPVKEEPIQRSSLWGLQCEPDSYIER